MSIKRDTVEERKALPLASGVLDYFPDALLAVAEVSRVGNEQHHPGQPLHWDKSKSTDEADALMRHLLDRGTRDVDGMRHSAKVAWRALALLQRELDAESKVVMGVDPAAGEDRTVFLRINQPPDLVFDEAGSANVEKWREALKQWRESDQPLIVGRPKESIEVLPNELPPDHCSACMSEYLRRREAESLDHDEGSDAPDLDYWVGAIPARTPTAEVEYRGEWPPDTRVNGLLTCCGQSEHALECPQYR